MLYQVAKTWDFLHEYRRLGIKSEASFSRVTFVSWRCNYIKPRIIKLGVLAATDLGRWISLSLTEVSSRQLCGNVTRGQEGSGECRIMRDWMWPLSFRRRTGIFSAASAALQCVRAWSGIALSRWVLIFWVIKTKVYITLEDWLLIEVSYWRKRMDSSWGWVLSRTCGREKDDLRMWVVTRMMSLQFRKLLYF
jgi:hypothetical protein